MSTAANGRPACITETRRALQLRSLIKRSGVLELSLAEVPIPDVAATEVLVRIEAAPLDPPDIGRLLGDGAADMETAQVLGTAERPLIVARIANESMPTVSTRLGLSMAAGNEGAGVVVEAGSAETAQALLGKTVAVHGGAMYSQYRCLPAEQCLVLPADAKPVEGAAAFVQPLTALGILETMRREGHTALVSTAAASSIGLMINRICLQDRIGLVNIVRDHQEEQLLRRAGAVHVCQSTSPAFMQDLFQALVATGATIAFDATGGGRLGGQILTCMEAMLSRVTQQYSRHGSMVHKQLYIYDTLDAGPTVFNRGAFGGAWGMGAWVWSAFLEKIGPAATQSLKQRVAAELRTTFATYYSRELSLAEALQPANIVAYSKCATRGKFLINPNKGMGFNKGMGPATGQPQRSALHLAS